MAVGVKSVIRDVKQYTLALAPRSQKHLRGAALAIYRSLLAVRVCLGFVDDISPELLCSTAEMDSAAAFRAPIRSYY